MLKLALIGKNIAHSKSESVYKNLLDSPFEYELLDYKSVESIPPLKTLLQGYNGISITAPYKSVFLDQVKDLSGLEVVNCLRIRGEEIEATNTDFLAVEKIIERYLNCGVVNIRILGSGSMSLVCQRILNSKKISFEVFSRNANNIENIFKNPPKPDFSSLVINTCSRDFIFTDSSITGYHFWDMNYAMASHQEHFSKLNVSYLDGFEQLELQAKYALTFWNLG